MVGKAFGVVLSQPVPGVTVEVATFRADGAYSDGRHPDSVVFTDAKGDAQRRDFTINGLFSDPLNPNPDGSDQVIDFVDGQADLKAGVIRAIGNPAARFGEDFLRLLRAVRFAARLRFAIEQQTFAALQAHAPKLRGIARERIGDEVRRMLSGADPVLAVQLLEQTGLAPEALMAPSAPDFVPIRLQNIRTEATYPTRLAAWVQDRSETLDSARVDQLRMGLNLTNDERDALAALPALLTRAIDLEAEPIAVRKRCYAEPLWYQAQMLLTAQGHGFTALADRLQVDAQALAADGIGFGTFTTPQWRNTDCPWCPARTPIQRTVG